MPPSNLPANRRPPKSRRKAAAKGPQPTLVLFVRHGQTPSTGAILPGRAKGLHLSDAGKAQAEAVAERLSVMKKVDAVYASPLERTRETAAPIGKALKLAVKTERGLLECDFGQWTGEKLRELGKKPEWRTVQMHPSGFRFPGGESFLEMQVRMNEAVRKLSAAHPGGVVVAVSHADPIKAVVADAMGTHLDLFQRIVISPCSVTAISYTDIRPTVLMVNSISGPLSEMRPS